MDKKKLLTYSILSILALFFFLSVPNHVFAEDAEETGAFTYKVIHPENQQSNAGYFDLKMTPNQKQTVQIEVTNLSADQPVTVSVKRNTVKTNLNGVLEYGPNTIDKDKSDKIDFDDLVSVPESITLAGGETKNLEVTIQMPAESYDGVVAGGIQLQKEDTKEEKKADEAKSGVVNKYAFIIGVVLSETDSPVEPEMSFNSIKPGLSNYRNAFFVNYSNTAMTFVGDMSVEFDVRKKGTDTILYDTKKTDMKMAPTSMINFPLLLNGDEMKAGSYTGHVLVTSGDKHWEWEEDFTVSQEEVDKYNKQDVSLVQEQGINWKLILMIVGGILIVGLVIFLFVYFYKKKNKKKRVQKKGPTNKKPVKRKK